MSVFERVASGELTSEEGAELLMQARADERRVYDVALVSAECALCIVLLLVDGVYSSEERVVGVVCGLFALYRALTVLLRLWRSF